MAREMTHDVFISHAHDDKAAADVVCAALETAGIGCWIAPRDITAGLDWGSAIVGAIGASRVMIVLLSASSNRSPQVVREVERAVSKSVAVLPIRLEPIAPSDALEYFLSSQHWLDAVTRPVEQHGEAIVRSVRALLARDQMAPPDVNRRTGETPQIEPDPIPPPPPIGGGRRAWIKRRGMVVTVAAGAAAVAIGVVAWRTAIRGDEPANGALLVRVEHARGDRGTLTDSIVQALNAELEAWPEIRVSRGRKRDSTLVIAATAARLGDSVRVVMDVAGPARSQTSRRLTRVIGAGAIDDAGTASSLVREALAGPTAVNAPGFDRMPGRSLTAMRAYVHGWGELLAGHLDSATADFRHAARADPAFAHASLWAAQSAAWRDPKNVRSWRDDAAAALRVGTLRGADSSHSLALVAMAANDYPTACTEFRDVTRNDPTSFAGWFGLGECARLDTVVRTTPRGLRFRSSHWTALTSYENAVKRSPTNELLSAVFPRILRTTYSISSQARNGRAGDGSAQPYSALPSLDADTLAFFPIPRPEFAGTSSRAVPLSYGAALRRGRARALDLTAPWVRRFPRSSAGWLQHSLALESAGRLDAGPPETSAATALDRAATETVSDIDRTFIAVARVRLALRQRDFTAAGRLARSALADSLLARSSGRASLAPLAALVDDVGAAERFAELHDVSSEAVLPAALSKSLRTFRIRAQLGDCQGLAGHRQSLDSMFTVAFSPAELQEQRQRLLLPAYREAVPCLAASVLNGFKPEWPIDHVLRALADGDLAATKQLLKTSRQSRLGASTSSMTWDYLFIASWALAEAGDSAMARGQLESAFEGLEAMSRYTLDELPQAAGVRRALRLLASLDSVAARGTSGLNTRWIAQYRALLISNP